VGWEKILVLMVFTGVYYLALSRKIMLSHAALGACAMLLVTGIVSPGQAFFEAIDWNVLGIYWGFMMVSFVFMKSRMPERIAGQVLKFARREKYVLLLLCLITAFLSAFMQNVGVVLIMAPVAIATAKRLNSSLFRYMIAIAVSSNVVTTVTMVADPPSIILAMKTGMTFFDFYWFQGKASLGTITLAGVAAAMLVLLIQFRDMTRTLDAEPEKVEARWGASVLFVLGVMALAAAPSFGISPGWVGLATGLIALLMGRRELKEMLVTEFDWDSFLFVTGIFVIVFGVQATGLLEDFVGVLAGLGLREPWMLLALLTWVSVGISAVMDNVPYTILMIPVCQELAVRLGISPWPLLFGMLVGTGIGGNITPVGATANVFACGILEKNGYKVRFGEYVKIGLPFSVAAVATAHALIALVWLR